MNQMTEDEARADMVEAQRAYVEIEEQFTNPPPELNTAERIIREIELKAALLEAQEKLTSAMDEYTSMRQANILERTRRAVEDLAAIEAELAKAVEQAENDLANIVHSVGRVLELSKKRYAHRQEATGRAPQSMLARNSAVGWIKYRLQDLDLPEFAAPRHYRSPLAELLGLDHSESEGTDHPQEKS